MIDGKIVYASQEEDLLASRRLWIADQSIKDGLNIQINTNDINEMSLATKSLSPILTKIKRERNLIWKITY